MPDRRSLLLASAALPALAEAAPAAWPAFEEIARRTESLRAAETAFAATLAARDIAAFRRFLAADTIWMTGKGEPLNGPDAVVGAWERFFQGPDAPFSWGPDLALVLPSGDLGRTSGPVKDPQGKVFSRFQSTWRRKSDGGWEIVFDYGTPAA